MSGSRPRARMLLLYVIMALAVLGIGTGIAHLADPHDGGVRGVWTADENSCNADGCEWGTFTAPGGTSVDGLWIVNDEPTHLTAGASFRAYFHDDGSDGQWVEIPHPFSGWWLLGPGAIVLIGAALVWWRRGSRRAAARDRLAPDQAAVGGRPIPHAYDLLLALVALAVTAGLTELIELCWPGHGWHYMRLWLPLMVIVGRILLEKVRVRRYGPERVAATWAYDRSRRRKRGSRRDQPAWGWILLLTVGWAALAVAVPAMSIGINAVLTDDLAEAWSCAAAVAITVALAVGVAALTTRVVRRRRAAEPTAVSDVERMSAEVLGLDRLS